MKQILLMIAVVGVIVAVVWLFAPPNCLLPGTKISMADGSSRNIEDIKAGDKVMAYNEAQGTIEEAEVAQTFVHSATRGYLTVNNKLRVTGNHPIYAMGRGWIRADELVVDDRLLHEDGADMLVEKIDVSRELVTTYNIEVKEHHNYFADGYLVHNKSPVLPYIYVTAAKTAESELQKLGAQFDYDVNGEVSEVTIREKPVSPAQFRMLLEFKNLQKISLVKCGIDDAALQRLKGLTKLSFLDVSGNPKVTDGCIDTLSTIKTLSTLNASDTGITSVGEEKLKEELPDCTVTIKAASAEPAK